MESPLFRSDLLTVHEPGRAGPPGRPGRWRRAQRSRPTMVSARLMGIRQSSAFTRSGSDTPHAGRLKAEL
jgi:hypothetical protein